MEKFYLIVGLLGRMEGGLLGERQPGYLAKVPDGQIYGFQLEGIDPWFAFVHNPMIAIRFRSIEQAEPRVQQLIDNDKGYFRPLSILPIYL